MKGKHYKEYIFWILFGLFLGFSAPLSGFYAVKLIAESGEKPSIVFLSPSQNTASIIKSRITSLVFVGDIMLGRGVEKTVFEKSGGDFSFLFENIGFVQKADISFGNLEGPIAISGDDVGNYYSFRFNPSALSALKDAGFDVLSVANNHAADWGGEAFEENIFRLKNGNILAVGGGENKEEAVKVKIFEKDGLKIGFLAFSDVGPDWFRANENQPGIATVDEEFEKTIKKAAEESDVLIVSLHFGEEYQEKSNERQKKLARAAVDSGALIVVGHHPHVAQETELYKDGVIAYSLGNFIFDQEFSKETMEGLALKVYLNGKDIDSVQAQKIKLNNYFQPSFAEDF